MNVVLDTNVLVSGLLSPFAAPAEIVRLVLGRRLTLCLDARLLAEYREVLLHPRFHFDPGAVAALVNFLQHSGQLVAAVALPRCLPDPDDQPFLEVARAGKADCLITGNRRHFPEKLCAGQRVLTPAEFIAYYQRHLRQGST